MSKVSCHLQLGEVPLHLYHLTAGFVELGRQGVINLSVEKLKRDSHNKMPYNMMEVIINGQARVLYDVNDGYDNLLKENQSYIEFMDGLLQEFDFCFKRSYSTLYNSKLKSKKKIYPLGLNYMVTVPGNMAHMPLPNDPYQEKVKKIVRMIPFSTYYNGLYKINSFEDIPRKDSNPKILFMARLWDIEGDYKNQVSSEKKEERVFINQVRAECIRLCRKEFGSIFFGGVSPSKFSLENYKDIVIQDKQLTKRDHYLKKVKDSSICIATMGLHESIGWKFAEYVAASKSIVTEKLHYQVPGNFFEEQNYLVFTTPEQCIEQIYRLLEDDHFRYEMMVNNYKYYHEYIRPDRLVLNSILSVLGEMNFQRGGEVG